jgi:Ca2+-binding EF-hand superfamily protein
VLIKLFSIRSRERERYHVDINEFMRGFILTTKGDLQTKIEYTFRIYDVNGDNQISGGEIEKMAQVGNDR